jgi:bla regulator protein blaR1
MTAMAQALSSALLNFVWQGVVAAFLLWVALILLRKRSANARYAACCAALALLVLLPAITAALLYSGPAQVLPAQAPGLYVAATGAAQPAAARISQWQWISMLRAWALPFWSMGVLLFSVRLVWGCRQVSLMRGRGGPADEGLLLLVAALAKRFGLTRRIRVLIAGDGASPSVVGWLRPVVMVPSAALLGLTAEQLESVLAHELAHIRRHDYLVNLLQVLAETLLFYHPAVWWVSASMRRERELCCDDLAVRCCGDAVCYARALTKLERLRVAPPAMAMGSNSGSMLYRIQRVLGGGATEYAPSKLPGILALAMGLACFGFNIHWAHGQEKPVTIAFQAGNVQDSPGVSVDLGGAALLHRSRVEYPGFAIERGIDGTVVAEVTLDASGTVNGARIVSGPAELGRSVLHSVLDWHFAQSSANGVYQIRIQYQRGVAIEHAAGEAGNVGYATRADAPGPVVTADGALTLNFQPETRQNQERAQLEHEAAALRMKAEETQAVATDSPERHAQIERQTAALREMAQKMQTASEQGATQSSEGGTTERQLAEARARIRELKQAYEGKLSQVEQTQGTAGAQEAKAQLAAVERQYAEVQENLAKVERDYRDSAPATVLTEGGPMTVEVSQGMRGIRSRLANRMLKTVDIAGLSDASKTDLIARLPVHVGDTLTTDSYDSVTTAIKQFDEHLEVRFLATENNQAELRITVPGSRTLEFRQVRK